MNLYKSNSPSINHPLLLFQTIIHFSVFSTFFRFIMASQLVEHSDRHPNFVTGAYCDGVFEGLKPARTKVKSVLAEGLKMKIDCIVALPI